MIINVLECDQCKRQYAPKQDFRQAETWKLIKEAHAFGWRRGNFRILGKHGDLCKDCHGDDLLFRSKPL